MRVVQIIDSLEAGGAERMAVNYANALVNKIAFSGLIATRKEGTLKNQIDSGVSYLFLGKKKSIDFRAIFKLRSYIKENKIDIIHAHSSSFFIAVLVKLTFPQIKIVWHDHYGSRANETREKNKVLIFLSAFFSSILVVNLQLEEWSRKYMKCSRISFIPNFATSEKQTGKITNLKGEDGKRIVFLANLKNPKNHILVLKSFSDLELYKFGWSLHLIGRDYEDSYSKTLKDFITSKSLQEYIHLYDAKEDVKFILSQASIGILASTEEGFPVTLLEYALANLAVISTNVGYCSTVIQNNSNGLLFNPLSDKQINNQLKKITEDNSLVNVLAANFKKSVLANYSEEIIIEQLILAYQNSK